MSIARALACVAVLSLSVEASTASTTTRSSDPQPWCVFTVAIHVTSAARAAPAAVPQIVGEADRIWRRHGVRLTTDAGASSERLYVRLVDDPPPGLLAERQRERGLGWITFLEPARPRNLIYLSWARTDARLEQSVKRTLKVAALMPDRLRHIYIGRALGRTLAHEVGHYLLASRDHSRSGLMRASYSPSQLFDVESNGFDLDPDGERKILASSAATPTRSVSKREPIAATRR